MGNSESCTSDDECWACREENHIFMCPQAARNPYIWFYLDVYKELSTKTVTEIAAEAATRWMEMSSGEKEPYVQIANRSKGFRLHSPPNKFRDINSKKKCCKQRPSKKRREEAPKKVKDIPKRMHKVHFK